MRRTENTRPCTSGGFALPNGLAAGVHDRAVEKDDEHENGKDGCVDRCANSRRYQSLMRPKIKMLDTLRLGPPQMLMNRLPASMPKPPGQDGAEGRWRGETQDHGCKQHLGNTKEVGRGKVDQQPQPALFGDELPAKSCFPQQIPAPAGFPANIPVGVFG